MQKLEHFRKIMIILFALMIGSWNPIYSQSSKKFENVGTTYINNFSKVDTLIAFNVEDYKDLLYYAKKGLEAETLIEAIQSKISVLEDSERVYKDNEVNQKESINTLKEKNKLLQDTITKISVAANNNVKANDNCKLENLTLSNRVRKEKNKKRWAIVLGVVSTASTFLITKTFN